MLRVFHPLEGLPKAVHITGEKAHYLETVLRCRAGDDITIFDGRGTSYRALIKSVSRGEVVAEINEAFKEDTESPLNIVLVQGLLKGEKMDIVVQKTTELGVKEIIPLITQRSQVRQTKKAGRWRKIAEDAARQSGRCVIPVVHEPVELNDFLRGVSDGVSHRETSEPKSGNARGLIFWEERGLSMREACRPVFSSADRPLTGFRIHLLIGPEGGFTREEVQAAESGGFVITSLGNRILRTETAAIAATAITQFLFGDIG